MKKKHTGKTSSKTELFDADAFVTALHRAVCRDLKPVTQEYDRFSPGCREATSRQQEEMLKKYIPLAIDTKPLEDAAFDSFLKVNSYISRVSRGLNFPTAARVQSSMPFMDKVHLRARALMHHVLGQFDMDEWLTACKNSSGSSIGVSFKDTSLEAKSTYPLTTTDRALPYFEYYLAFDWKLKDALEKFNANGLNRPRYEVVVGARATTVDKNADKKRFISIEPTANMFLQQGLMLMMYRRMKAFGLDVESLPDLHKQLALISSITTRKGTIDWSSASDCNGIGLIRWLTPPKWFEVLDATRSPSTRIRDKDVTLAMFSTMGNAVTFPLETLVFWTYAHAVRLTLRKGNSLFPEWEDLGEISVFGDDCIVPSSMTDEYILVMEMLGFTANLDKTHVGPERFRESCGGDYLAGYPVRPYCLQGPTSAKKKPALEAWLYTVYNELSQKYIQYFGSLNYIYDRHAFNLIFEAFRELGIYIKILPPHYPSDAGVLGFDSDRLFACYPRNKYSKVTRDYHGTWTFRFLRFNYRTKFQKDPGLRYALALKTLPVYDGFGDYMPDSSFPSMKPKKLLPWNKVRKNGGYVVAKGYTAHWAGLAGWRETVRS